MRCVLRMMKKTKQRIQEKITQLQAGCTELDITLSINTTLTQLDICKNVISVQEATALAIVLICHTTLTHLNMDYNHIKYE